jgi:hypothetical protein
MTKFQATCVMTAALSTHFTPTARAANHDAVLDIRSGNNPSGPWSYLWSDTNTSPTQPLLGPFTNLDNQPHELAWWNQSGYPDACALTANTGDTTLVFATIVQPPDLLRLDPQNHAAWLRFTASHADTYSVYGRFQIIDTSPHAHRIQILRSAGQGSTLLDNSGGYSYGQQFPFQYTLSMAAGETLDFVVSSTGDPTYLSTGLSVSILTPCTADWTGDGRVNVQDFLAFLSAYASGDPRADIDGDGQINIHEVLEFLQLTRMAANRPVRGDRFPNAHRDVPASDAPEPDVIFA